MTLSVHATRHIVNWGRFALLGLCTVFAAVFATILVYSIGSALVVYDPDFFVLSDVLGTISPTLVAAIGAVLLYAALLRRVDNPARLDRCGDRHPGCNARRGRRLVGMLTVANRAPRRTHEKGSPAHD